jgi:4-oxalocrotonate tautomerase
MPIIQVRYANAQSQADVRGEVAQLVAEVSARTLGKAMGVTAVISEPVDPAGWFVGGMPLSVSGLAAFWLQITITAGTNTRDQTAAFVAQAFAGMRDLLGPLDERSYVHVQTADGDAYGFGGRTQTARRADVSPA